MQEGMTNDQLNTMLETIAKLIEAQAKTPQEAAQIVRDAKTKENRLPRADVYKRQAQSCGNSVKKVNALKPHFPAFPLGLVFRRFPVGFRQPGVLVPKLAGGHTDG